MIVLKFGGTSVGSAERMKSLVTIIRTGEPKLVVLSAMSGTTDKLVNLNSLIQQNKKEVAVAELNLLTANYHSVINQLYAEKETLDSGNQLLRSIFNELNNQITNYNPAISEKIILAHGELLSTHLFQLLLTELKIKSALLLAPEFVKINLDGEPDYNYIKTEINRQLDLHKEFGLLITQGFICSNSDGNIDNLGRGGSDYTATLLGAAINAEEIQIWTDIDGIHNNDPRYIENTSPIRELSFDEAAELAYFGAKILHPSTILPAKMADVPVRLKNTLQPTDEGTLITKEHSGLGFKAVAAKDKIIAIKIRSGRMLMAFGFMRKVFEVFELYKTPVDMITTSEVAISITIDNDRYLSEIVSELEKYGSVSIDRDQTIVAVVGELMAEQKGYARQLFSALREVPIRMISYGASKHNISILVSTSDKIRTLQAIHHGVFNKYSAGL